MQLVLAGLREHYIEAGYGPDEVEAAISRRLPAVSEVVASIAGQRERLRPDERDDFLG
jgi:hypothetical protein